MRDLVVWKAGDEQGRKLCFPKATGTITQTQYPDGTSDSSVEGNVLMNIDGTEYIASGNVVANLSEVGSFYQEEGIAAAAMDADGISTFTTANGKYINVCELLSASALETSSSTTATVTGAAWIWIISYLIISPALALNESSYRAIERYSIDWKNFVLCWVEFLKLLPCLLLQLAILFFSYLLLHGGMEVTNLIP